MTISNTTLVEKAVITTDALAAAGKLNPAQSDRFIDYVVDETVLKNNARIVRFRNESLEIDKIGVGKRVAMPKAEAADPALRRGVNTSKVTLQPRELIVPFEVGDIFKEINIEGESVEDHIIQMMAKQLANDLEDLYINGESLKPAVLEGDIKEGGSTSQYITDEYLGMFDGWLRLSDGGNIFDAGGANIGLGVFGGMLRQLPTKFRRDKRSLRFYMSPDLWQLYLEKLSTRATVLGDAVSGGEAHTPFGVQAVAIPLWDLLPTVTEHVTLASTTQVALRYQNVQSAVVTPATLGQTPTTPFIATTDYVLDSVNGLINRTSGGAIADPTLVKVTYKVNPQILLTHMNNFIVGIGRDIRIERDRDIFKGVNQYAITAKVAVEFEEDSAIVKGVDIGQGV